MSQIAARRRRGGSKGTSSAGFAEEERPFLHDEIVRGVEAQRVKDLIDRGVLGAKHVFRVIPERTFNRRLASREPLKPRFCGHSPQP